MDQQKKTQIHGLYVQAYEACQRAIAAGKPYIGFRHKRGGGFTLIVSKSNCNGQSSAQLGLATADWASNVLYRLREQGFIETDLPLDEYFEELHNVRR